MQINGNEARQLEWDELPWPARCSDGEQLPDAGGGSSRYGAGVAGITLTMIYQRALESPSEALNRHEKRLRGTRALAEQSD